MMKECEDAALTFQEFLAGILLKEGLVNDRAREVVDH